MMNRIERPLVLAAAIGIGFALGSLVGIFRDVRAQGEPRIFELRTYTTPEGKLPNLNARFRDHTMRIFEKHGMTNVGYWTPQDAPASENTLVYILAHRDRDAAAASWQAFRDDPEWKKVSEESQVDGRIVAKVESMFLNAADYSPLK
ncbi:MAG TPA: NIPSNAP family protein [Vicinamibacteria bacterium]|nr:NIPSNAP family protein [Vicinamibacteria bacterium]